MNIRVLNLLPDVGFDTAMLELAGTPYRRYCRWGRGGWAAEIGTSLVVIRDEATLKALQAAFEEWEKAEYAANRSKA
jgi:hypothetical protein